MDVTAGDIDAVSVGRCAALRIRAGRYSEEDAEVLAEAFELLTRPQKSGSRSQTSTPVTVSWREVAEHLAARLRSHFEEWDDADVKAMKSYWRARRESERIADYNTGMEQRDRASRAYAKEPGFKKKPGLGGCLSHLDPP